MSKKVIEPVIIEQSDGSKIEITPYGSDFLLVIQEERPINILNDNRTTVAKAIYPEYQKVIDQNKFLEFENARLTKAYQKSINKTHELNDQNAKLVEAFRKQIEIAYRCGESGKTYFFEDTTCILPRNYEGIDG